MCFHGTLPGCSKTGWALLSWQGQASTNAVRTEYMLQPMAIAEVLGLARLKSLWLCLHSALASKFLYRSLLLINKEWPSFPC